MPLRLIRPTPKYKDSFIAGMRDFENVDGDDFRVIKKGFPGFLKEMRNYARGKNLPKGHVESHYLWLMRGDRFVGEVTIRPMLSAKLRQEGGNIGYGIRPAERRKGYGTQALALALRKLPAFGLKKALVTCDDDNSGSWKIIEANGGVLKDKITLKEKLKRRYYIAV